MPTAQNKTFLTPEEQMSNRKTIEQFLDIYKPGETTMEDFMKYYGNYYRTVDEGKR